MLALFAAALAVAIPVAAAALLIPASVASSRIGLLDCLVAELVIAGKSTNTYFSGNPVYRDLEDYFRIADYYHQQTRSRRLERIPHL